MKVDRMKIVLFVFMATMQLWASNGVIDGNGEPATPFMIEDISDFNIFADTPSMWKSGVYVKLCSDLDLFNIGYEKAVIAPPASTSTSYNGQKFDAVFNGAGHKISNLCIDADYSRYVGLFGYLGSNAIVCDLALENCNISGNRYTGGICGQSEGGIYGCKVAGNVTGGYYTAGLCGYNYYEAIISNCAANCSIEGVSCVGGLAGSNASATIIGSTATGYIYSSYSYSYAGGICGANGNTEDSYVLNCSSYAEVEADGDYAGGLCGWNFNGNIAGCFAAGNVLGCEYVGGLVGCNEEGIVSNSYSLGSVTADYTAGGFCGENSGEILYAYSAGAVYCDDSYVGGFCGYNDWEIGYSLWDTDTSGISDSDGASGYPNSSMILQDTFLQAGWDFTAESANGENELWRMPFVGGYPILAWQKDIPGDIAGGYGVGLEDFAMLANYWQQSSDIADLDTSGLVEAADLHILCNNWLCGK